MKKVFLIAIVFLPTLIFSQQGWTLQDCIAYAQAHNLGLKRYELNNEMLKNNHTQSKASFLPNLNSGAQHTYNFGKTIDRFTNTFADQMVLSQNFYINSQVTLWSGLGKYNSTKANEYDYLSGVEGYKQQQNDLSLSVANAYIGVIFQEDQLKVAQQQYELTKEQLSRTLKLVEAGSIARSSEFELRLQLAGEEVNITAADNAYQIAMLDLQQLMNLDSVQIFKLQRPEILIPETSTLTRTSSFLYESSLQNQPGIKSAEYKIKGAEKRLAASRGGWSPSLSLNGLIGTGTSGLAKDILETRITGSTAIGVTGTGDFVYAPSYEFVTQPTPLSKQFNQNINKSIGLQLTIPLFNGLQTQTSIMNAELAALDAKFSQDQTKQTLYKNIAQAQASAKAALNTFKAQQSNVDATRIAFDYAKQKFDVGAISAYDYNLSKTKLFAAETNLLKAKYDFVFRLKVLDYYEGKPLGF
jgi:outer membrane protein